MGAEHDRLGTSSQRHAGAWKQWGPYLAERSWGTVREDYSADGDAWRSFPHDHARSRTYRWSEDGLAGISDLNQHLCFALALWNHRDPILKERLFGLTGEEGNHGEDVKECWWFVDSTPTHSWMRWRYHYPQRAFPYADLIAENHRRGRDDPEYELLDTGVFDGDRYWVVEVDYAKAAPDDIAVRINVTNAGPESASLAVLPTIWFRNTWSWGSDDRRPTLRADDAVGTGIVADHWSLGRWRLTFGPGPDGSSPELLFCENETNGHRLFGLPTPPWPPKDAINDRVVSGADTCSAIAQGTKAAGCYDLTVPAGRTVELRVRLRSGDEPSDLASDFDDVVAARRSEADEYYAELSAGLDEDEARVVRQACAGLLWSKQLYHFDVDRWLQGDPAEPAPPPSRAAGRNAGWRHLDSHDVLSMPDTWEYPWFAAWDLAFHCVVLADIDPELAKHQLTLLCREWYMHPNGQLPAYEWEFGDTNPPVHAWAALEVFERDDRRDHEFLERIFHKLLLNFTWWVNRVDASGDNVFQGGFLGLDNIGPFNRSAPLPVPGELEQSDGTAWMAMYCLNMLEIALTLAEHDRAYEDVATKFFEHFAFIAAAMETLWDDEDGFYYDALRLASGEVIPLRVRSMVGLVSLFAVARVSSETLGRLPDFNRRVGWFLEHKPRLAQGIAHTGVGTAGPIVLSILSPERLRRVLRAVLDEDEFLSPYGVRSLSRHHLDHPFVLERDGIAARVGYEPGEGRTPMFGGNSNWRGPVWLPLNHLLVTSLRRFHEALGPDLSVELPSRSGNAVTVDEVAAEIGRRLCRLMLRDQEGRRPVFGEVERSQSDPRWRDLLWFHEYFHGDTGAGLGASHQTGWTALIADLLIRRGR